MGSTASMPSSQADIQRGRKIEPRFVERVWGSTDLSPWFPPQQEKIGEVWFEAHDSPLLVKFIFASEDLSVQVHPDDAYARKCHNSCGKTEMWHILDARPRARIAAGLKRTVSRDELANSLADGSVMELLNFTEAQPGDTHLITAGTIHAIGAGVKLCEIQQNCDITYRLYDYNRGRELHIDHGLNVAERTPYDSRRNLPVETNYFRTAEFEIAGELLYEPPGREWVVMLVGEAASPQFTMKQGEVWDFNGPQSVRLRAKGRTSGLRISDVGS